MAMTKQMFTGMGLGALLLFIGAGVYVSSQKGSVDEGSISEQAVADFTDQMREGTVARVGQPIEGFEPSMFIQAFPGLVAADFNNVDAAIGLYRYQNGEVVYDLNGEQELHSAARAISDEGMLQLLVNVSTRLNYNLGGDDTVADVIAAISVAPGLDPTINPPLSTEPTALGTKVTLTGTITCLPHKGGPASTMECAYGLKADNGSHYGLKNLFTEPGPWEFGVGDRIEVTGMLLEPGQADNNFSEIYDIVGTVDVESKRGI